MAKPVPTTERDERPRRLSARVTGHAEGRRNLQGTSVWGVVVRGRRHRGGDRDDKADDAGVDRVDADNLSESNLCLVRSLMPRQDKRVQ